MLNDEEYDEVESSQSVTSKSKKTKNIRKKQRRSRITINDKIETEVPKREIYDLETKIRKTNQSAVQFNMSLNKNRAGISKHFLKRKIKAAFEREPLEKAKPFFNVLFIPNLSMFQTQPTPPQQVPSSIKHNAPVPMNLSSGNKSMSTGGTPSNVITPRVTEFKPDLTKRPTGIETPQQTFSVATNNIPVSNITIGDNKPQEIKKPEQIGSNIIQIRLGDNSGSSNVKPSDDQPKPMIKPELTPQQKQNLLIKQLVEKYLSNPEKLRSEMSPHDFLKLQHFIKKNMSHANSGSGGGNAPHNPIVPTNNPNIATNNNIANNSNNNIASNLHASVENVNIQLLKNNLSGPSVSVNLNNINPVYSVSSNPGSANSNNKT
jgi:hypothetical protein